MVTLNPLHRFYYRKVPVIKSCVQRHTAGCWGIDFDAFKVVNDNLMKQLEPHCSEVHCDVCGAHACLDKLDMKNKGEDFCM